MSLSGLTGQSHQITVIASEAKQSHLKIPSKIRHCGNSVIAREQSKGSNLTQNSGNSSLRGVSETNDEAISLTFEQWRAAETKEWQARFDEAARLLDIERSTDRTMAMLEPLFAKRASRNPHIMLKGQLRFGFDGNPY